MKFNVSGFTHVGTIRENNQDRILVQDHILLDGISDFEETKSCFCFVADGIGGHQAGDVAAQFVLEYLLAWQERHPDSSEADLQELLESINQELLDFGRQQREYYGLGTTLVGLIVQDAQHIIVNVGDSPLWLLRNDMFYQLTENQVVEPYSGDSPLTSYFGGKESSLVLQFCRDLREIRPDDLFMLCSDGVFKALKQKQIKAVLLSNQPLNAKARFLLNKILENGAEDNVSCIVIEVVAD